MRSSIEAGLEAFCAPGLDPAFWPAARAGVRSAWCTHIPFAQWLVATLRPRLIVELGTHNGASYGAFCEAVQRAGLACRCVAVDSWAGDPQAGYYGEEVFAELRAFHDARYGAFSELMRCTFSAALGRVADGSVDLLHIDGLHTYEAVRQDFEDWRPKLSARGVVLLHDTTVRERGFGVWRVWAELREVYPGFEFLHGFGLGVLAVGPESGLAALTGMEAGLAARVRERFAFLGERWGAEMEAALARTGMAEQSARAEALEQRVRGLEAAVEQADARAARAEQAARHADAERAVVLGSTAWRATAPVRAVVTGMRAVLGGGRRR